MKKVVYLFAAVMLVLVAASCNKKDQQTPTFDYSLELAAAYNNDVKAPEVTVKLSEEGLPFILAPFRNDALEVANESEIFAALMQAYGSNISDFVHTKSGVYSFPAMSWEPGATYTIVGFIINKSTLTQQSAMAKSEVVIPEASTNKIQLQYDNDSIIFVSTTNRDPYYLAFTTEKIYLEQIESGLTTVSQFVTEALKAGINESKENHADMSYSEVAELYLLSGSMSYNFTEEYADFEAGTYYALACGVEVVDKGISFTANPTTQGVALKFTLAHDYILPMEVRAQIRGMHQPFKAVRSLKFKVDQQKVMKSVRID